jgi:hypothetical protein
LVLDFPYILTADDLHHNTWSTIKLHESPVVANKRCPGLHMNSEVCDKLASLVNGIGLYMESSSPCAPSFAWMLAPPQHCPPPHFCVMGWHRAALFNSWSIV